MERCPANGREGDREAQESEPKESDRVAKRDPLVRDTKQRILDAALEVFADKGFHAATVDQVAAAAGVTKGAVYYYFQDKDDLARDLQHLLWEDLAQRSLAGHDPHRSATANVMACFEVFLRSIQAMPGARIFLREAWFSPTLDEAGRADHEDALGLVQGLIEAGIAAGELVPFDPETLARVLTGALMEATVHVLGAGDIDDALAVMHHVVGSLAPSEAARR